MLHMAQSPDGSTVVSAAADETLRFWKCFGDAPIAQKVRPNPHSHLAHPQTTPVSVELLWNMFDSSMPHQ